MPNVLEIALRQIMHTIPKQILDAAFRPTDRRMSLDQCIQEDVILGRVLPDCICYAGNLKRIVLKSAYVEKVDIPEPTLYAASEAYCVYRIPPEARDYKDIVTVISVNYPNVLYGNMSTVPPYSGAIGNTANNMAAAVLETQTFANTPVLPSPILVSGHQVKLAPVPMMLYHSVDWVLTCRLAYDEAFTNLSPSAVRPLANLILCATKNYIYNELILAIDSAYLVGGQELGRFKEIVDGYSGEQEKYDELVNKFRGAATILDPEAWVSLLPTML